MAIYETRDTGMGNGIRECRKGSGICSGKLRGMFSILNQSKPHFTENKQMLSMRRDLSLLFLIDIFISFQIQIKKKLLDNGKKQRKKN